MEATADYYATLGVEPGADGAAIRIAYRNLMRRYHPDVNKSEEAVSRATAINEAYACLSDADARASYDWRRNSSRPSPGVAAEAAPHPSPRHSRRPRPVYRADIPIQVHRHKWNWTNLALAVVLTVCTFTATSFVPPVVSPTAEVVQVDVREGRDACESGTMEAGRSDCNDPKTAPPP